MLALFINQTPIDLSNDISITLKFSSPIFNSIGDYTYPFKLPATAKNVSLLGFKHRVENSNDPFQVFDATLEWNGVLILKGTLRILKAQSDFYEATLFMDKGDFFYRRKKMTLQDIDFGEMEWVGETLKMDYFNACRNTSYPDRLFALPQILNDTYFADPPALDCNRYFNCYIYGTLYYYADSETRTILVPMLYLRHVLDVMFKKLEYSFDDSFFSSDPDYNTLVLYNNVDANCTATGLFNYDVLKVFNTYHVPLMSVNDFLSGLENFFNIRFFVNNVTKTVKLVSVDKIVKSIDAIDFSKNVSTIYTEIGDPVTGFNLKMKMDSDDTVTSNLIASQDSMASQIKDAVDTFTDLPTWPGAQNWDIRWVRDESVYYIMYDRAWSVSPFGADYQLYTQYIYKEASKIIETSFSTLANVNDGLHECLVGNAQDNWKDTTAKLFFIKFHPYGGTGPVDEKVYGSNATATKSLFYCGEHGLFAQHFKAFCDFQMSTKEVKIIKQMTLLEINELDFSKKYEIQGNNYLLSEVQVSITNTLIKPATIKAFSSI